MSRAIVLASLLAGCFRDAPPPSAPTESRDQVLAERERALDRRERLVEARERALAQFAAISGAAAAPPPAPPPAPTDTAAIQPATAPPPLPFGDDELVRCVSPHHGELMISISLQWGRLYRLTERLDRPPYSPLTSGPLDVTLYDPAHRALEATAPDGYGNTKRVAIHGDRVSLDLFSTAKKPVAPYTDHVCVFRSVAP